MARDDDGVEEPFDEDDMREAFRRFLQGDETFDPADLMKAAGINVNNDELKKMMAHLTSALGMGASAHPTAARDHAVGVAKEGSNPLDPATAQALTTAAAVGALWLSEVTEIAQLPDAPLLATRVDWARKSFPVWEEIANPVAVSIPRAISGMMSQQAPEELIDMMGSAKDALENVGKSLFQLQLAQVVGKLSSEVLSGGDIGIPLIQGASEYDVLAVLVAQNIREFSAGLDVPTEEADIFLAVREIAHARLFRHARWLRLHLMSVINDFASGISIDSERIMNVAEEFDPTNPQAMQELVASGKLLPERSEEQDRALARLETMLALIEGWVDHLTKLACQRLPKAESLAEAIRRRRASGGPAERAFATLVGLELRPRKLREASALWEMITHEVGHQARDELWRHPDSLPTQEDLSSPEAFVARLTNPQTTDDDMDKALRDLLDEESSA
jgi:putative hydrolase